MEDNCIVDLYWARNESAIEETKIKYGRYCYTIAYNVLGNKEDADESVNDTYLVAWNSIPPNKPKPLAAYLGKLARNISLKKWRDKTRVKRGGGQADVTLSELGECITDGSSIEEKMEEKELAAIVNDFVKNLPDEERRIFVRRYWYMDSVEDIAKRFDCGKSKIKMKLLRTRNKLSERLKKEGLTYEGRKITGCHRYDR